MIEIINLDNEKPYNPWDFLIDSRTPVGNTWSLQGDESRRDKVCDLYQIDFDFAVNKLRGAIPRYVKEMIAVYKEHGKLRLFCWCAPKRCHGETIKKYIESKIKEALVDKLALVNHMP